MKRDMDTPNFVVTEDMIAFSGEFVEMCDRILSLREVQ